MGWWSRRIRRDQHNHQSLSPRPSPGAGLSSTSCFRSPLGPRETVAENRALSDTLQIPLGACQPDERGRQRTKPLTPSQIHVRYPSICQNHSHATTYNAIIRTSRYPIISLLSDHSWRAPQGRGGGRRKRSCSSTSSSSSSYSSSIHTNTEKAERNHLFEERVTLRRRAGQQMFLN